MMKTTAQSRPDLPASKAITRTPHGGETNNKEHVKRRRLGEFYSCHAYRSTSTHTVWQGKDSRSYKKYADRNLGREAEIHSPDKSAGATEGLRLCIGRRCINIRLCTIDQR